MVQQKTGRAGPGLVILILASAIILGLGAYAFYATAVQTSTTSGQAAPAKLRVEVVDGMTETPIEGATVVIPELGKAFDTDKTGKTGVIDVPFLPDKHYDGILPQPWGEITLLVYKQDYATYALFHCQVVAGQTRMGPKILLFKNAELSTTQPFSIIEGPNRIWVNELIKKYQPK